MAHSYTKRKRQPSNEGKYGPDRKAWVETYIGTFSLMAYDNHIAPEGEDETLGNEPGETVRLMIQRMGRASLLNITALTHEELKLMRELFNLLFDRAEPVVILRDKAAKDASDQGDDGFVRNYRPVPRLIIREGQGRPDRPSIQLGREDVPPGDGEGAGSGEVIRGASPEVADAVPEDRGTTDHREEAYEPAFIREMGKVEDA